MVRTCSSHFGSWVGCCCWIASRQLWSSIPALLRKAIKGPAVPEVFRTEWFIGWQVYIDINKLLILHLLSLPYQFVFSSTWLSIFCYLYVFIWLELKNISTRLFTSFLWWNARISDNISLRYVAASQFDNNWWKILENNCQKHFT